MPHEQGHSVPSIADSNVASTPAHIQTQSVGYHSVLESCDAIMRQFGGSIPTTYDVEAELPQGKPSQLSDSPEIHIRSQGRPSFGQDSIGYSTLPSPLPLGQPVFPTEGHLEPRDATRLPSRSPNILPSRSPKRDEAQYPTASPVFSPLKLPGPESLPPSVTKVDPDAEPPNIAVVGARQRSPRRKYVFAHKPNATSTRTTCVSRLKRGGGIFVIHIIPTFTRTDEFL